MECNVGQIAVHYEEFGVGTPIMFLHGWTVDHHFEANDYEPILSARQGWRRIYLDLPGHGRTPSATSITCMDDMLDVVLDFIDTVIAGQRFVLSGSSAGANLSRGVVLRGAAQLDGLLLRVPLIKADDSKREVPAPVVLVENEDLRAGLKPEEESGFALAVVQSELFMAKLRADSLPARRLADFEFLDGLTQGPRGFGFSFDVNELAAPFPAPTLIVTGRQDALVGYRDAFRILDAYPRATFAVLDRAGHILPVEQTALFAALVDDWLDRVEEYCQ